MTNCVKRTTKRYTDRPSPPYPANECCGKKKRGNDGRMWLSKKYERGICRWVKSTSKARKSRIRKSQGGPKGGRNYYVHDNGGRPFMVKVKKRTVWVYKLSNSDTDGYSDRDFESPKNYQDLVKKFNVKKTFIGKGLTSPKSELGNTILLELAGGKYVWIGSSIYEFKPKDKIVKYFSQVGSSDVPYPVALGEENAYFMIEDKYVPRDAFPEDVDWYSKAYPIFYGIDRPAPKKYKIRKKVIQKRKW